MITGMPMTKRQRAVGAQRRRPRNIALINGQWFEGKSFERTPMYSVDGRFTFKKPARIDQTIDLNNGRIVPPFAECDTDFAR